MLRFDDLVPVNSPAQPEKQIWFLTATDAVGDLYAQVAHQSQILVGQLNHLGLGARIVWKPPINGEHQHSTLLADDRTGLVGSIIWPISSVLAPALENGLLDVARPALLVTFTDQPRMPGDDLPANILDLSNPADHPARITEALDELGVNHQSLTGTPAEPQMQSALRTWVANCSDG